MPTTPPDGSAVDLDALAQREWLAVNHLGGYACSTVPAMNTRKYHGLLVAAMAPPVRRLVLLSRVEETVRARGWPYQLACNEYPGTIHPEGHQLLRGFAPAPFPRWAYQGNGWSLEKSVQLVRGENTVVITYTLLGADEAVEFDLRPLMALRPIHELMYQWNGRLDAENKSKRHHRIPPTQRTPEVFFAHDGAFEPKGAWYFNTIYRCEQDRGYGGLEDLWSPGVITWKLRPGQPVHFVCSSDPIHLDKAIAAVEVEAAAQSPSKAPRDHDTDLNVLVRAAGQFVVELPVDSPRRAIGQITQFPWSAPSVRDALISMPGILLVTGKYAHARAMLEFLSERLRRGLIPTHFPENGSDPVYGGADTSLWFINALWQYIRYSGDESTSSRRLLEAALDIIDHYRSGADLGITTDSDGLLASRLAGAATSWMDAKVGDWVITPRTGRPVELNALWHNALCIAAHLCEKLGPAERGKELSALAARVRGAFATRFWNAEENCCYDVIEDHGPDPSVRPNQLLAIGLPFPVLPVERHAAVLQKCRNDLLTPFGPRTLSPKDHSYQGRYGGNVVSRDRAHHQGSVHPWLLGAYVSATVRLIGRGEQSRALAMKLLASCLEFLRTGGAGQLCELFDGDAPHRPGGAIASATAVGELLRSYVEDVLDQAPRSSPGFTAPPQINPGVTIKVATKS